MFKKKRDDRIRPVKGKCPCCKAGEREWCKDDCKLLDPANAARE